MQIISWRDGTLNSQNNKLSDMKKADCLIKINIAVYKQLREKYKSNTEKNISIVDVATEI